jgi:predicted RNA binding protein YcfA (HicA-like mRNA interferase family)
MKLPRDLDGNRLAQHLGRRWGYVVVHQVGSHIVLETGDPAHQRVVVPAHRALRIGTLSAILRLVAQHKGVSREDLLQGL